MRICGSHLKNDELNTRYNTLSWLSMRMDIGMEKKPWEWVRMGIVNIIPAHL